MNILLKWSALMVLAAGAASVHAGAVVSGKDSKFATLDVEETRKIFLGRESSLEGHDVVLVYQKTGNSRDDFDGKVLGKKSADLDGYWSRLVFSGRAASVPKEVDGDEAMKSFVNATPGAIGYVSDEAVDPSVKVLWKY